MGCGMGMIKYLLFIFNFIFAVCGLGILALAVVLHLQLSHATKFMDTNFMFPSISLMVIGSIIFLVSFFGCCGAIRESHCMTITFASCLLFILLIQVAIAVYSFVVLSNDDNRAIIADGYKTIFERYYTNHEDEGFVDFIQNELHCCGVTSSSDFNHLQNSTGTIPPSCCGKQRDQSCAANESYPNGCGPQLTDAYKKAGTVLGGVAIGIAGVELLGIIFSLYLANSIKNAERRGYRV
ncbi:CD63 antigen-like isoform X1 [Colletes gigas]|uniref:CD63 antigen-like isoform X1 n=1 Tax=Colletes gigas TaxID=935657 RepID=UPI001C9B1DCC|nr:CD63 antigen-like isoform X1 [Colletes gigas]XP_043249782.1 CD63 antigen-like isoform X1 [Colletes gigas]